MRKHEPPERSVHFPVLPIISLSIIVALSLMTKQLVSSITTLNSSMDHSFTEMNETLGNLAYVEESANEEGSVNSDAEKETDKAPNKDSASTED